MGRVVNRALLLLLGLSLGANVVWFVRSRGDDGDPARSRIEVPSPSPTPTPALAPDPIDQEAAALPGGDRILEDDEVREELGRMNWCGTGTVGEGGRVWTPEEWEELTGPPIITVRVRDVAWLRLLSDLTPVRLPTARKALIRTFLDARTKAAPATDVAYLVDILASLEPSPTLRARLLRVADALRERRSWEPVLDGVEPPSPPEPIAPPSNR